MDISKRDLELFLVLADERSFTRAALKSNISQSALSSRIKILEDHLGVVLFDRTTRAVELTNEGKLFEVSARKLYSELSSVIDSFRDQAARRKGRVKIGAIPSLCSSWLPEVFVKFRALYPGIELHLTDGLQQNCLDMLRSGAIDLAVTSSAEDMEDLQATLVGTDYFHLVCPTDHPLLAKDEITPADLVEYPFVQVSERSSVRPLIDAALHPLVAEARLEVQYMGTIAGMVEAGLGISVVPALSLWQFKRPSIASRLVLPDRLSRPIHIFKRRGHTMSPAAQALYEHALQHRKGLEALARAG